MGKPFAKDFIEKMKSLLLEEKTKLESELSEIAVRDPKSPSTFNPKFPEMGSGEDENAAEVAAYGDNLAVASELQSAFKDVVGALNRIDKGTYGVCRYCEKPIDERRLIARPASSSCIPCKKLRTQEI